MLLLSIKETYMNVLVTGGAGYIGSHTVVALLQAGYHVVIADNLSNSKFDVIQRIEKITGIIPTFYQTDVCDSRALFNLFEKESIDAVIHFAGYKAVGESMSDPLKYYRNNLDSALTVLEMMQHFGVKHFVFSSSATVYGIPDSPQIKESFPIHPANCYGRTKAMIEEILMDLAASQPQMNIAILRYFNPIGAHTSALIGEDPNGIPNNLMPYITQVAIGKLEKLHIFGNDYHTKDGTGVRDYIHVCDLADGHLAALKKLETDCGLVIYNLGTGIGYSVLDIVHAFEDTNKIKIPYVIDPRRSGDIDEYFADPQKAYDEMGWATTRSLAQMCEDSWNWQTKNPNGYM